MADDTLREQVSRAVCSIAIGSERVETVMDIIREHTAGLALGMQSWRERAETAEAAIERVRALASDDADLRSGVVGMVRVSDIRRALDGTEAP